MALLSRVVAFKMVESFKIALPRRSRQLLPSEFLQTVGYTLCESIYELICRMDVVEAKGDVELADQNDHL